MSTTTEVQSNDSHAGHAEHTDHPDSMYVKIAVFLAVLTGIEVALSYMDIGAFFLPLLLGLMVIKFVTVVLFFMHLRFDSKWFNMAFWAGLFLAVACYGAALFTFRFFG